MELEISISERVYVATRRRKWIYRRSSVPFAACSRGNRSKENSGQLSDSPDENVVKDITRLLFVLFDVSCVGVWRKRSCRVDMVLAVT